MSIKLVMPSSHLILCRPLLPLPLIPLSNRAFSNESTLCMRWPKYWSFSFSIIPSKEHPGLISSRVDWLDILAVQGTLKSLLQHHSSKASILQCSAFFTVQHSHPYMTTGKTIALTRRTFVGKVMSLLFNMLSRLVPLILLTDILAVQNFISKLHFPEANYIDLLRFSWTLRLGAFNLHTTLLIMTSAKLGNYNISVRLMLSNHNKVAVTSTSHTAEAWLGEF